MQITGEQMIQIVRDQRAVDVPGLPIVLPVPKIGTLDCSTRRCAGSSRSPPRSAALILLLGLVDPPGRSDAGARRSASSASRSPRAVLVFGYIIPVHLVPAIDDSMWAQAIPRLAMRTLPFVLGAVVVLAAAAWR